MTRLDATLAAQMEVIHCASCNVPFALMDSHVDRLRQSHKAFHCPAGHSNVFNGKSDTERLKEELERIKADKQRVQEKLWQLEADAKLTQCPYCSGKYSRINLHITRSHFGKSHV
jgi:hypothetical protein